jgi:predicted MFS family arabinose efflux permease
MASQLGGAIAPFLVIPIQARYGWRAPFLLFGCLGVVWGAVWYGWYRDLPSQMPGISKAEVEEIGAPSVAGHGLPWKIALRSRNFWRIAVAFFTSVYGIFFFQSWLHTYLVKGRGFSEKALLLSTLPYLLGAVANALGGLSSDALVKKFGLKTGRRAVAVFGMAVSAVFITATITTTNKFLALLFLAFAYAGETFTQPVNWAVCIDVARKYAGAVSGAMNTASQLAGFLSSVIFGYLIRVTGLYDLPLLPMAVMLLLGAVVWMHIDATEELIPEPLPLALESALKT